MHFNTITLLSVLAATAAANTQVEADDVPLQCRSQCQSTIDLSRRCDIQADNDNSGQDDDIVYNDCFCKAPDAQARINECATCVKANGMANGNDDNEVAELMRDCGWDFNTANATPSGATGGVATPTTGAPTVTMVPTTISTAGGTLVVSTPSVIANTALPTATQPGAAGAAATPMLQGLVIAGIAAALF